MHTVPAAARRALTLINQAPPIGLEVVDFWGSGWCRLRIKTPQDAPRIAATTYQWLKDHGLIKETRYGRSSTTGKERNRRYATLTETGRAVLADVKTDTASETLIGLEIPATQLGRASIGERLKSPNGTWRVAESWVADKPGAQGKERDYKAACVLPNNSDHVYYLLTHDDGHQEEWSAPDMADAGFHRILLDEQQTLTGA